VCTDVPSGEHKKTAGVQVGGFIRCNALNDWALSFLRLGHRKIEVPEIESAIHHNAILAGIS
jgi:hypothetical protein